VHFRFWVTCHCGRGASGSGCSGARPSVRSMASSPDPQALDPDVHRSLGLTDDEAEDIARILGRPPNHLELAMYSVMWSEHCSYKSSRIHLRRLPTEAPWVLVGPGEGAGVVDVGDGIAAAIRIESHNHPSAIEPYQGAATGVGGILRDIFSMGARPIALMDPLRFGPLDDARSRWIAEGVVVRRLRLRQLGRRAHGRRRDGLRRDLRRATRWSTCCASASCPRTGWSLGPPRVGQPRRAARVLHRARRHRRRVSVLASAGFTEGDEERKAAERPGGRPLRGEAAHRGVPRAARRRPRRSASRTSVVPASPVPPARRRQPRAASAWTSYVDRCRVREEGMEPFEIMTSGVPGAHAGHRRAGQARRGPRHLRQGGRSGPRSSAPSPAPAGCGCSTGSTARCSPTCPPLARRAAPALRPPARRARRPRRARRRHRRVASRHPPTPAPTCSPCCATPRGCGRSTTTSCSSTPSRARAATPRCCA
jgi:hypothetical protein